MDNLTMPEAISAIQGLLASGEGAGIAFVNADCINIAADDKAYLRALTGMDRIFMDGIGMRIAGRLLGSRVRGNVNGTDLFPELCESLAFSGKRLFLFGAKPGRAEQAACWARKSYPGLRIAGALDGYRDSARPAETLSTIRDSRPDVVLVALGAPLQEKWIQQHRADFGNCILIGVGGLFDYYSGNIPRAPRWMRQTGLEWVFRLMQEPGRLWRRYLLGNAVFLGRVLHERIFRDIRGVEPNSGVSP
jgi:N-acetylglucosaminyldiphosphoundecaprenol N-acetyl-beta-D-mannosaminyltransferase